MLLLRVASQRDIFHRYIKDLNNVKGDGNYGFRLVAVGLGRDENMWPLIRQELLQELRISVVFISMVKNVVLSSTCFPLWSGPHESESTEPIVVARVGGSHFINLLLREGYLIPSTHPQWRTYRIDRASAWEDILGVYYMSLFKAPECVLKKMETMRAQFFWGGDETEKKMSWIAWSKVLNTKEKGGLGI
ncbi:hypothetical protein Tco_0755893 [Tanacetum coccineum]